jgi:hypothetical protein
MTSRNLRGHNQGQFNKHHDCDTVFGLFADVELLVRARALLGRFDSAFFRLVVILRGTADNVTTPFALQWPSYEATSNWQYRQGKKHHPDAFLISRSVLDVLPG